MAAENDRLEQRIRADSKLMEIRNDLSDTSSTLDRLAQRLDNASSELFAAVSAVVLRLARELVDAVVLGQVEFSRGLGEAKLTRLRSAVAEWGNSVPAEVRRRLENPHPGRWPRVWTYPGPPPVAPDEDARPIWSDGEALVAPIDDVIRELLVEPYQLLARVGYTDIRLAWWRFDRNGSPVRYMAPFEAGGPFNDALREYARTRFKYMRAVERLRRLERAESWRIASLEAASAKEAAEQEVRRLWPPWT